MLRSPAATAPAAGAALATVPPQTHGLAAPHAGPHVGIVARSSLRPALGALCLALLLAVSPAFAHALLRHASPAAGATVPAPHALRLTFSEAVEPLFSRVTLKNTQGEPVKIGPMRAEHDGRELVLGLPTLSAGSYTVTWHVTSVDTHKTEGTFHFVVSR